MYHTQHKLIYETAPMKIGKLQWRAIVYEKLSLQIRFSGSQIVATAELLTRFIGYQFMDLPEAKWSVYPYWHDEKEHPNYDSNDGCYAGLPKTLRKLWENNRSAIETALGELAPDKVSRKFREGW